MWFSFYAPTNQRTMWKCAVNDMLVNSFISFFLLLNFVSFFYLHLYRYNFLDLCYILAMLVFRLHFCGLRCVCLEVFFSIDLLIPFSPYPPHGCIHSWWLSNMSNSYDCILYRDDMSVNVILSLFVFISDSYSENLSLFESIFWQLFKKNYLVCQTLCQYVKKLLLWPYFQSIPLS